jgi:hypothetical protein
LTVFASTLIDLVANSTPIVDFDSRLNSLRVNRESTVNIPSFEYEGFPTPIRNTTVTHGYYTDIAGQYTWVMVV